VAAIVPLPSAYTAIVLGVTLSLSGVFCEVRKLATLTDRSSAIPYSKASVVVSL
jgi:hypothetical protein